MLPEFVFKGKGMRTHLHPPSSTGLLKVLIAWNKQHRTISNLPNQYKSFTIKKFGIYMLDDCTVHLMPELNCETPTQVFFCKYWEILKNCFFIEHLYIYLFVFIYLFWADNLKVLVYRWTLLFDCPKMSFLNIFLNVLPSKDPLLTDFDFKSLRIGFSTQLKNSRHFLKHSFGEILCESWEKFMWKIIPRDRSSHSKVFLGKEVLKICSKFTGEHPSPKVISIKLFCNFDITLRHWCSPVILLYIFRTPFPYNTFSWLLLQDKTWKFVFWPYTVLNLLV